MSRAARAGRARLAAEALESRDTPAGIFASAVAPGNPAVVSVFDAASRQLKFNVNAFDTTFTGGVNVAIGDVNGDGTADLITGAGLGGGAGVHVFSGVNGELLKSFSVGDDASHGGVSVAAADFDNDGKVEIVAGGVLNGQPIVQVLRFSDGSAVQTFTPFAGVQAVSVAAGDFNGDGTPDVAAGAGPGGTSSVVVFNGKDGSTLLSQQVFEDTFTGGVTVSMADINADGNSDVIVSARTLGGPRVTALAGPTGAVVQNFFADDGGIRTGVQAVAFDVNADGRIDLVTNSQAGLKTFDSRNLSNLPAPTTSGLPIGATYDTTAPTATVSTTAGSSTSTSPIPFRAVFSEPVNGFSATSVAVTNGTAGNVVAVDTRTYTFDVTPTGPGTVTVAVNAGGASDAAGNGSAASTAATVTFTTSGPTVTIAPLTTNDTTPTITGSVSDPAATVVVTVNGQSANATVDSTGNYSATLTTPLAPGTYTITATATDQAGKTGNATQPNGLIIDTTTPTPTVSTTAPEPTNTSPIPFKVAFDQDVTGFASTDVTVVNGTVANFTSVDAQTYTFNVLPAGQGAVTVSVPAGAATDAAGNPSAASNSLTRTLDSISPSVTANPLTTSDTTPTLTGTVSDSASAVSVTVAGNTLAATVANNAWSVTIPSPLADGQYTIDVTASDPAGNSSTTSLVAGLVIDTTPPTVALTTTATNPTGAATIPVKVQFSEIVTGFDLTDVSVTNGTASNLQTTDNQTFTVDVAPHGDGPVTVLVPANAAQDHVQLGNTASNTITVNSDRTAPTATINATSPTNAATIPVTVTFSEPVTGFDLSKVTVGGGTASNFAGSGANYTFDVTPAADGTIGVTVVAGGAQDGAGNTNPQATFSIVSDRTAPTVTIAGPTAPTNQATTTVHVTFSEIVTGFDLSDLMLTNAMAANLTGSGTTYTFDLTAQAEGSVAVSVKDMAATDGAGNNSGASNTVSYTFDSTAPTVTLTGPTAPTNQATVPITVTFSEPVTGFDLSDLTLVNAGAANLSGSGASYTFDLTAGGPGTVSVTVNAAAATDTAGNTSGASNTISYTFDGSAPTGTINTASTGPITGTAADTGSGVQKVEIAISNGPLFWSGSAFDRPTAVPLMATSTDGFATWSYNFTGPDGTYQVTARFTDNAGNVGGDLNGTPTNVTVLRGP